MRISGPDADVGREKKVSPHKLECSCGIYMGLFVEIEIEMIIQYLIFFFRFLAMHALYRRLSFYRTTQQRQELLAAVVAVGVISEYSAAS